MCHPRAYNPGLGSERLARNWAVLILSPLSLTPSACLLHYSLFEDGIFPLFPAHARVDSPCTGSDFISLFKKIYLGLHKNYSGPILDFWQRRSHYPILCQGSTLVSSAMSGRLEELGNRHMVHRTYPTGQVQVFGKEPNTYKR